MAWARTWICPFDQLMSFVSATSQVLEIGCGTGVFANLVALDGPDRLVTGCDISVPAITAAQQTVGNRRNIKFVLQRVEDAVTTERADVIAAIDLFHHLAPDTQVSVLRSIYEGMKADGTFLLKDIDRRPRWKYFANVLHDAIMAPHNRIYCRTQEDYRQLLESIGFRVQIIPMHALWYSHVLYICRRL